MLVHAQLHTVKLLSTPPVADHTCSMAADVMTDGFRFLFRTLKLRIRDNKTQHSKVSSLWWNVEHERYSHASWLIVYDCLAAVCVTVRRYNLIPCSANGISGALASEGSTCQLPVLVWRWEWDTKTTRHKEKVMPKQNENYSPSR